MISGSFVLTDTLGKSFDGVYQESYARHRRGHQLEARASQQADGGDRAGSLLAASCRGASAGRRPRRPGSIEDDVSLVDGTESGSASPATASASPSATRPTTLSRSSSSRAPGRRRQGDRDRPGNRAEQRLRGRPDGRRVRRRPGPRGIGSADSSRSVPRARSPGRRSPSSTCRPRSAVPQAREVRPDPCGAKPASPATLVERLTPKIRRLLVVNTTQAQAASGRSKQTQEGMNLFKYILIGFGGIALFVGSFVIANTLAITVAQRMRELATLRTLGAVRRRCSALSCSSRSPSGIVGSVIGLFLGLAIALGLMGAARSDRCAVAGQLRSCSRSRNGDREPRGRGASIALFASLRPAPSRRRASSRSPPSAKGRPFSRSRLRADGVRNLARHHRISPSGLFSYGMLARRPRHRGGGSARSSPACCSSSSASRWSPPASSARWRSLRRLARRGDSAAWQAGWPAQNAVRNPSRTASTAAAVMIGLALITFVAVIGQGVRSSFSSGSRPAVRRATTRSAAIPSSR